jgi:pimeloyl-ACP methyl ester carboxylesterase
MPILFELRYPTKWYTKLFMALVALAFFIVLATSATAGFILYRIVKPQRSSTEISMASFPGKPDAVTFTVPGLGERDGWFFPGLRNAPTILLLHGYESSRGELLTLESALQDHEYNVFIFDFAAHGANGGVTTFGYREADEVRAAIDAVATRNDVDPARFGIWGYNLGAYAGLREAENDKRIRAMVLDSVYDQPAQMVKVGVERNGLGGFPLMIRSAEESFLWLNRQYREAPPLSRNLKAVAGVPTLYIEAADDPELGSLTRELFLKAPEPREEAVIAHGNFTTMADDDKRAYENRVVSFFLLHLPPTRPVAH